MSRLLYFFLCLTIFTQCVPADDEPMMDVDRDVKNGEWQKVYNYQDQRQIDSLLSYTSDPNPAYRYILANALAVKPTDIARDSLLLLLQDPVMEVRVQAAFALGQSKDGNAANALLSAFKAKDTLNIDNLYNGTILAAVGKTGGEGLLKSIATVSTYRVTDTLLLLGQARAIYSYALRGITLPEGTDKMVEFVINKNYPTSVRVTAAGYLRTAKDIAVDDFKFQLTEVLAGDENPFVRMSLAALLGRTADRDVMKILLEQLESDPDYRVKVSILRSLSSFPYINVIEPVLKHLNHPNLHVASTAADFLISSGNRNDAVIYRNFTNDTLPSIVNAKIYSAVLKHIPVFYTNTKSVIKVKLLEYYQSATDVYKKADYVTALGYDPYNYRDVAKVLEETKEPVVKAAGMEAIKMILQSKNFVQAHRSSTNRVKKEILDIIKNEMSQGDAGSLAVAGTILSDKELEYKDLIDSVEFISEAMGKLVLPQEIETYNSLAGALAYLSGSTFTVRTPDFNHPIDYGIYTTYGDSVQAAIKTDKGLIRVDLYVDAAPGSVANFLQLASSDFYDGKVFHRVVPNFVVQVGCPRGDGYGALDYTIRTEVTNRFFDDEGYLGMASAGADTESTQWFITQSPTPHLDGKYTLFGKVVEGMEVVHELQVGDKIQDVIITKK